MRIPLLCFLLGSPLLLSAQNTFTGDSLLANERSIDRPVTVHARQLRISGGYGLYIISRRFDDNGKSVTLRDEGLSSVRHRFSFDVKYGVTEHIQLNAAIARSSNVVREQTRYIFPIDPAPVVSQDVMREYSGVEDLYLAVDVRAPLKTRKFDFAVTLGASLPVTSGDPHRPGHTFEAQQENGSNLHRFVYHYNYPVGKGITTAQLGAVAKIRTPRWAFSARVDYTHGLSDGESYEWRHQLTDDGTFEYRQDGFSYRLPDSYSYFAETEYQPLPWFDLFLNVAGYTAFDGWTASQEDLKIAIPYQAAWTISPGFEIVITPRLWLRERINFSVSGKNYEAPLAFQTSIMYNFFPFK
jgi:hypothetical protein